MENLESHLCRFIMAGAFLMVVSGAASALNANDEIGATGQEVAKVENTGHQIQVWRVLPEYTKASHYRLSVKHAVPGKQGAFFLTAWADTNKDRKPDKKTAETSTGHPLAAILE